MKIFLKLYANLNLGDDLFLKILLERYPQIKFYLPASDRYKLLFNRYENLEVIEDTYNVKYSLFKRMINSVLRKFFLEKYIKKLVSRYSKMFNLNDFDAFVSIGGSIFMQKKIFPVYNSVVFYKTAQKKYNNTFFLGCNFGPYTDSIFLHNYKDIFAKATDVCFRESNSWELFKDLGNVRYLPDIVFGLDISHYNVPKIQNSVGLTIIKPKANLSLQAYVEKYVELIKYYKKVGYEVFLFSFCEAQGDGVILDLVMESIDDKSNISRVIYNGDIDDFLAVYGAMEQMYCGRFHSMILSMIFNQKIFPVIYSSKMTNVLEDINYKGTSLDLEEFCNADVEKMFSQINSNYYDISDCRNKSMQQFKKLDELVN